MIRERFGPSGSCANSGGKVGCMCEPRNNRQMTIKIACCFWTMIDTCFSSRMALVSSVRSPDLLPSLSLTQLLFLKVNHNRPCSSVTTVIPPLYDHFTPNFHVIVSIGQPSRSPPEISSWTCVHLNFVTHFAFNSLLCIRRDSSVRRHLFSF